MSCDNCKFATHFKLELIPEPTGKWFFGLLDEEMSELDKMTNEMRENRNKNYVRCDRFPKSEIVRKYYQCGEYVKEEI